MQFGQTIAFPLVPQNRLAVALCRLQRAQAEQGAALARLRDTLARLRAETAQLERSTLAWDGEVRSLGEATVGMQTAVTELQRTAERLG